MSKIDATVVAVRALAHLGKSLGSYEPETEAEVLHQQSTIEAMRLIDDRVDWRPAGRGQFQGCALEYPLGPDHPDDGDDGESIGGEYPF